MAWKRTYGGLDADHAQAVATTSEDGALVCGSTGSFGVGGDAYVLRIDQQGDILWSRHIGGDGVEAGQDAVELDDGTILMIGYTNSFGNGGYDGYIVALASDGSTIWERTYGGEGWDFFHGVVVVPGGVVVVGVTSSYSPDGIDQLWLVKVAEDGSEQWSFTLTEASPSIGRDVILTEDERVVAVGSSWTGGDNSQLLTVACDPDGGLLWFTESGGTEAEHGYSVASRANGDVAAVGFTESYSDKRQMFMARIDAQGDEIASGPISSSGNDWEAHAIILRPDGTYAIAGYTKEYGLGGKDFSLLFADETGAFLGGPTYGGTADDEAWGVDLTLDGGYYVVGATSSFGPGIESVFVVRSDGDTLNGSVNTTLDPLPVAELGVGQSRLVFPNPAGPGQVVTLPSHDQRWSTVGLMDACGRLVAMLDPRGSTVRIPMVPAGPYFLHPSGPNGPGLPLRLFIE
ncbi:MAG: hypothetical protein IPM46_05375 [Flavobacteriales bacterium]|nr:hypothetical protein [Flavobacteriales bacterium]